MHGMHFIIPAGSALFCSIVSNHHEHTSIRDGFCRLCGESVLKDDEREKEAEMIIINYPDFFVALARG